MKRQIGALSIAISQCILSNIFGDVAQWLERGNSNLKTLGSRIPWRGRVGDYLSVLPSQLLCRLVCA